MIPLKPILTYNYTVTFRRSLGHDGFALLDGLMLLMVKVKCLSYHESGFLIEVSRLDLSVT
jgi:hypothetical protein